MIWGNYQIPSNSTSTDPNSGGPGSFIGEMSSTAIITQDSSPALNTYKYSF